ncbi:PREDICTED: nascent polypeptide-associated complex subunit alpha, muscle-specific form-like [Cyprinodon variegatus]|uniref:nascent polypeptide-associated complex subunit alpha, muscle-specific form-like n=1 Tax=Cyprinodon variegatus TaxID=28743 RepID=UPI000742851E|nr:PREDICTED: nascent polypeptide-associated complex subunit alpha, muscle-specific form-like [Cyprinodon variegatus]
MPAPWGAAKVSPRAPPAAGHPEVGPGKEHHGTDRNAPAPQSAETRPAPRHQAPATGRNTHRNRTTLEKHTGGRAHSRGPRASAANWTQAPPNPPKTPPRPKARPHPTKTDANSTQPARGQHRARAERTTPLHHRAKPEQHGRIRRPPSPLAQANNTRSSTSAALAPRCAPAGATPAPTRPAATPSAISGTKAAPPCLQTGKLTRKPNQRSQPIHTSPPTPNLTEPPRPPHTSGMPPAGPPPNGAALRENRHANPPRKKNGKQKSHPNATVDTRHGPARNRSSQRDKK